MSRLQQKIEKKVRKNESGQILVLTLLMTTTLIIMFGIVVSVGHLVQAKINLQNAVDLAAMSGASVQARFLNQMGEVNYRMRQNYKMVLFDLYVTQSRYNNGLVRQVNRPVNNNNLLQKISVAGGVFGICQQAHLNEPRIEAADLAGFGDIYPLNPQDEPGRAVDGRTNLCQNYDPNRRGFPGIEKLELDFTSIGAALLNVSDQARLEFNRVCNEAGEQNSFYFDYIVRVLMQRNHFQMQQMEKVLLDFAEAFEQGSGNLVDGNPIAVGDNTVLSTFRDNLTNSVLRGADLNLEFINPFNNRTYSDRNSVNNLANVLSTQNVPNGVFAEYFDVSKIGLKIHAVNWRMVGGNCSYSDQPRVYPGDDPENVAVLSDQSINDPQILFGLTRKRNRNNQVQIPFNIALKASVKPNLLFWPRGLTPTITAVAAAKPFGSRLGPPEAIVNLETSGNAEGRVDDNSSYANVSFFPGDVTTSIQEDLNGMGGIAHLGIIGRMWRLAGANGPDNRNERRPSINNFNPDSCLAAGNPEFLCYAMAPSLYEGLFYNVFPSQPVDNYFGQVSPFGGYSIQRNFLNIADDDKYCLPDRMNCGLANGRSNNWHNTMFMGANNQFRLGGRPLFFADQQSVRSSWSPHLDPDAMDISQTDNQNNRSGYQIKLTSLKHLCQEIDGSASDALELYCQEGVFH